MRAYLARVALALDILANTVLAGEVETISSRMGRQLKDGRRCVACSAICWLLSRFWPGHCLNNIMQPMNRKD